MQIKVEVTHDSVSEALNRLLELGENPAPALDAIGQLFTEKIKMGFATSTDPYGRPWAPLRVRRGQPLLDSGDLQRSINYHVDGNSVEIGTDRPYAPTHQFGATIEATDAKALRFFVDGRPVFVGRGHKITIPARMMFPTDGLPNDWAADAVDAIADVFERATRSGTSR